MPVPPKRSLKHYRGDDWRFTVRLEKPAGTPVDLTGWSATVETDPDVTMTSSTPDATGVLTLDMPASETVLPNVPSDIISFDLLLIDPSGFKRTYLLGVVALQDEVP